MDAQLIIGILSSLGVGGLLKTMLDAWVRGRRDAARARGLTPDARAEAAYYAEELAALRERALAAGMTPEELGPRPAWTPTSDDDD